MKTFKFLLLTFFTLSILSSCQQDNDINGVIPLAEAEQSQYKQTDDRPCTGFGNGCKIGECCCSCPGTFTVTSIEPAGTELLALSVVELCPDCNFSELLVLHEFQPNDPVVIGQAYNIPIFDEHKLWFDYAGPSGQTINITLRDGLGCRDFTFVPIVDDIDPLTRMVGIHCDDISFSRCFEDGVRECCL